MASPGSKVWRPCPHTHQHIHRQHNNHHHCRHCPLHLHLHHCRHCPLHNYRFHGSLQPQPYLTPFPQNPQFFGPFPLGAHPSSGAVQNTQPDSSGAQISQKLEDIELDDEEEDDEPVFVLTDEWREFFAKSEARRQLEKKQGKKGKK